MRNVLRILKNNIASLIPFFVAFLCYYRMLGVTATLLLAVFFVGYALTMTASYYAQNKLLHDQAHNACTPKRTMGLSLLILCPIYLFWLLFSIIPIPVWEVWFITGFPIVVISSIPSYVVLDGWRMIPKTLFWSVQSMIYLTFLLLGQMLGNYVFFI